MARKSTLREELIRTGAHFLDTHRTEELTIRKIAALCNVTPHAIYNHFKNKEALLEAIYTYVLRQMIEYSIQVMLDASTRLEEKIYRLAAAFVELQKKYPNFMQLTAEVQPAPHYRIDLRGEKELCECAFPGWPKFSPPRPGDDENAAPFEHLAMFSFISGLPRILHEGIRQPGSSDEDHIRTLIRLYLKRLWLNAACGETP